MNLKKFPTSGILLSRIENLCIYFRDNLLRWKKYLRNNPTKNNTFALQSQMGCTRLDRSKVISSIKLTYNEDNTVQYPIYVSATLRILNLGYIEFERQNFHSSRNLIPIGYKSVRQYSSMFHKDRKCEYICEILDNVNGPHLARRQLCRMDRCLPKSE